jgi:ribosomal protein S15P/S13E
MSKIEGQLEPTGYSHKDCDHESTKAARAGCRKGREELPEDIGRLVRKRELLRSRALELGVDSEVTGLDHSNVDALRLTEDIKRLREAIEPAKKDAWDRRHQARIAEQERVMAQEQQVRIRSLALEHAVALAAAQGLPVGERLLGVAAKMERYLRTGETE